MTNRSDPHRTCSEREYHAARTELEQWLGSNAGAPQPQRIDELLAQIESYEASTRFVPDWSDESFRNAA